MVHVPEAQLVYMLYFVLPYTLSYNRIQWTVIELHDKGISLELVCQ